MEPAIQLKNVSKIIGKKKIIDNISLDVYPGEVFGLLGPNGAGKTTTIRMIVGLMKVSAGEIIICGKNLKNDFEAAIREVGAIVENPEMYNYLSGYQNLMQVARIMKGVTKEKINEIVKLVGLEERIHDKVKTYSLGMRQRLGIAQSLLHDPKVLILDEPTNGLDPAGIREIRDYLRTLAKEKDIAIIVSSHLLSEMEMMCDRIAIIQKGKLVDVQSVHDDTNVEHSNYVCTVHNPEVAVQLLKEKGIQGNIHGSDIEFQTNREEIPSVIQWFVANDVRIYELKRVSKSLEERFLEVTENGEDQNGRIDSKRVG